MVFETVCTLGIALPTFLSPWWGLLSLAAIPIILMYILRQKRPDMPVSSTLLWSRALADMRASTPWQKLRRNLLLLLQLLILAALVLTLMRPVIQTQAARSVAGVIVIDATASMQATDHGGPSRLERAKQQAHQLVDALKGNDRFMVISDGGGISHASCGFTTDKSLLHKTIDDVAASDTSSDLSETLLTAATQLKSIGASNANQGDAAAAGKIWLFSDGAGIHLPNVKGLADMLQFVKIGDSSDNVGIVRVAVTPVPKRPDAYEIFVGLTNAAKADRTVTVGLAYGEPGKFMPGQAKEVRLPASGTGGVVFEQVVAKPGRVFVQVAGSDPDDFPLDNTAYVLLEAPRAVRATLVTRGDGLLEGYIRTAHTVGQLDAAQTRIIAPEVYKPDLPADLVIFDNWVPDTMPRCDALLIRPPGNGGGFKIVGESNEPTIIRWKRDDPVMAYMELNELYIHHALKLDRDPELNELAVGSEGPLLAAKDFGSARRYIVPFSVRLESNWWQHPSFLIFLQNIIKQTRIRHFIGSPQILPAGQPAQLWDVGESATIQLPRGGVVTVPAQDGAAQFAGTDHVGFYQVNAGDKSTTFAVNLLNPAESDITPRSLESRAAGNIQETTTVAQVNREIWPWAVGAALLVLMVEWYIYHRRIA